MHRTYILILCALIAASVIYLLLIAPIVRAMGSAPSSEQQAAFLKFALSNHTWNQPIIELLEAAKDSDIPVIVPEIGAPFNPLEPLPQKVWWE
jgi:hypothetical protein